MPATIVLGLKNKVVLRGQNTSALHSKTPFPCTPCTRDTTNRSINCVSLPRVFLLTPPVFLYLPCLFSCVSLSWSVFFFFHLPFISLFPSPMYFPFSISRVFPCSISRVFSLFHFVCFSFLFPVYFPFSISRAFSISRVSLLSLVWPCVGC